MSYHGYIEVEVRLLRQGYGADSSGVAGSAYAVEQTATRRIEERDARELVRWASDDTPLPAVLREVRDALHQVIDADEKGDLSERWARATADLTADKMRLALEVLER